MYSLHNYNCPKHLRTSVPRNTPTTTSTIYTFSRQHFFFSGFFFLGHTGNEGLYYEFKDVTDYGKDVCTNTRARTGGNAVHAHDQVYVVDGIK